MVPQQTRKMYSYALQGTDRPTIMTQRRWLCAFGYATWKTWKLVKEPVSREAKGELNFTKATCSATVSPTARWTIASSPASPCVVPGASGGDDIGPCQFGCAGLAAVVVQPGPVVVLGAGGWRYRNRDPPADYINAGGCW